MKRKIKISPKKNTNYLGHTTYSFPHDIEYYQTMSNGVKSDWIVWGDGTNEALVKTQEEAREIAEALYLEAKWVKKRR